MSIVTAAKHWFRVYCYADARFAPSFDQRDPKFRLRIAASRLDDGSYRTICTSMTNYARLGAANYLGRCFARHPALFLIWLTSSMRENAQIRRTLTAHSIYRRAFPEHRIVFLCNEEEERTKFVAAGLEAILCSHNAFADETVYRPIAGEDRMYDAIYNASMTLQKRRHLARLVPKAAHIFREVESFGNAETRALLAEMKDLMPNHDFLNPCDNNSIVCLDRQAVNSALAKTATGLCLSQIEGAMFASVEYLLAGLPVVSTPSTGGRHLFGSPETWLTVDDTAEAVRDGVSEMKARAVDPVRVRTITLAKIYEHRTQLRDAVARYTDGAVELPVDGGDRIYRGINDWIDGPTMVERLVSN